MNRRVDWDRQAEDELDHERAYYEGQEQGLGVRFDHAVIAVLDSIIRNPFRYPIYNRRRARLAPLRKFKHAVVYRVRRGAIQVVGVVPLRGHPTRWMNRG